MERIMVVVGTRPEAIKLCPLILELKKRSRWEVSVCSTGQHRTMLEDAMRVFDVKPDVSLDVMRTGQTVSDVTSRILSGLNTIYSSVQPSMVLVQGDTATAFSAALAAFYRRIPIGHVEAGLRTYHLDSPFPEEFHRETISLMATYHFAPTISAKEHLIREGRSERSIFVTGNTVVDALRFTLTYGKPQDTISLPERMRLLIFTAHRRESFGKPLVGMFRALRRVVEAFPDVVAVCPLHRNPDVRSAAELLRDVPRIRVIEPPETVTFHHLLSRADLVMTDSGGIQEEAVALGIPTLVMRFSTERCEGIRAGVLRLAGTDEDGIYRLACNLLAPNSEAYQRMKKPSSVFGDGYASTKIADCLETVL